MGAAASAPAHRWEANRGGARAEESRWSVYPCSAALVASDLATLIFVLVGCGVARFIRLSQAMRLREHSPQRSHGGGGQVVTGRAQRGGSGWSSATSADGRR
jgi:hypothetical protein